ncbi:band 7 protein AGAP004871 isoform X10 [Bactrocera neohumeralis]|uniref:band 7 protein AGAP004871 isoform X10 n=1 Tax=Bactrocera neohumeralis TaxID=98809 RepID=UPI0021658FAC|nr:band 7 protein AGAP004871 isoform X10 [Bactrocera neohumeralis]
MAPAPVGHHQHHQQQHNQKSAHMHHQQHQQHHVAYQHQQANAHTHAAYGRRHSNTATTTAGTTAGGAGGGGSGAMGLAMPGSSSSQRESRPADTTVSGSTMYSRDMTAKHSRGFLHSDEEISDKASTCGKLLIFLSVGLVILTLPFSLFVCFKVVQEYERAVIFRLGRLMQGGAKGPGIFFILPCIDSYARVDLRTRTYDVPPQEVQLDEATDAWGIKVERVEIKDVRLPVQLQRAMAAEAEAAREARAKVIAAEGEQKASKALREASEVIGGSPAALQLRYLQTLNTISAEKNSTIVFPLPIDLITYFLKTTEATAQQNAVVPAAAATTSSEHSPQASTSPQAGIQTAAM